MNDWGLVSSLPLLFYASLTVLTFSFCFSLCAFRPIGWVLGLHLVLFIFIVHGTPALTYGTLRYSWAWKHVGIVDYVLRHGVVDRTIDTLGVYHNWPGFFAASALLVRAAGLDNALGLASWAPVFFNLLNFGALFLLFGGLVQSARRVWLALWLVAITSWVGQDYFSPQAFAFFFYLVALAVAARWFAARDVPAGTASRHFRHASKSVIAATLLLLVGLFAVISSSHQLTPVITVLSLGALVLFTRDRALALPALMGVIMTTWFVYGATPFFQAEVKDLIESFGKLSENIDGTLIDLDNVSRAQRLVALAGRALTLSVWGLALAAVVKHVFKQRSRADWGLVALTGAPFLLLIGNAYGGEILFRIYLFALPFMALWIASLVFAGTPLQTPVSARRGAAIVALSAFLLSGFIVAYYGKEQQFYFPANEVEAAQAMYRAAPKGSLIVEGSRNYPSRFTNYENYTHVTLSLEPRPSIERVLKNPAAEMKLWMSDEAYTDAYLIITRGQKAEIDLPRTIPSGSLEQIERSLSKSPDFEIFFENEHAVVFTLKDRPHNAAVGGQP